METDRAEEDEQRAATADLSSFSNTYLWTDHEGQAFHWGGIRLDNSSACETLVVNKQVYHDGPNGRSCNLQAGQYSKWQLTKFQ